MTGCMASDDTKMHICISALCLVIEGDIHLCARFLDVGHQQLATSYYIGRLEQLGALF